ncbi:hypothetical protein GCM10027275_13930 [Rhabdobacter roseus]|uniref:Membrane protease YdiL (CAAX protease family) n=1 Tax=Rhabdobacter roseus TaxID=1655419 RepID=A0A840TIW5_9BACT|nr:CPBP family glutamic-type intramembrane protease [Rhabdobacter roseus]MBB5283311.1 membrane protease YdiL (CAAX protease family) [Rhabdobacter roseus]
MTLKDLLRILIINGLFANAVNLIFLTSWGQHLWQDWRQALLLGVLILVLQTLLIARLIQPYRPQLRLASTFTGSKLLVALGVGLVVWGLTQACTTLGTGTSLKYPTADRVLKFGLIFLFNSVPNALLEEFVYRHVPVRYGQIRGFSTQQILLLGVAVTFLFSIAHVSAYLFRDHTELSSLTQALRGPFLYGLAFLFVYMATRNIYFVTLVHAFSNNPLYLVRSPFLSTYYLYTFLFVTILWMITNEVLARRASLRRSP